MSDPAGPGAAGTLRSDAQTRRATIRLLRVLAASAILLPALLFAYASWLSYRQAQTFAEERIERSLDVMQEQALKTFQSMNLAVDAIAGLLANLTAAQIQADAARLHERLKQIHSALPEVQSIWVFGPTGHPLVITREYPAPNALDYSGDDYFIGARDSAPQLYIGGIHQSTSGGRSYFTFSRAYRDADAQFGGVIEMSLLPNDFSIFYTHLAGGPGMRFSLLRDDGTFLARYPPRPEVVRLSKQAGFHRVVAANPAGGLYTSISPLDHLERRGGVRQLPGFPVYVLAATETRQIRYEWITGMAMHLIFGVPATAFLFGAILVVLQRTKRLYAEQDRREAAEAAARQSLRLDRSATSLAASLTISTISSPSFLVTSKPRSASSNRGPTAPRSSSHGRSKTPCTARAATLTKRLLAFSRQQPLNPVPFDTNQLINGLSDFLRRALGEHISLEIVGAAGVWPIEADQGELETTLLNLAVNARDAMPDGGRLTIDAGNSSLDANYCRQHPDIRPGRFVISVTDSGAGMTKEVIDRAFEPFFTTKGPGGNRTRA